VTHRKDKAEERAIALLDILVEMDQEDRDALPGSAMHHIRIARGIMKKRRKS
jgi:hypothetical protein